LGASRSSRASRRLYLAFAASIALLTAVWIKHSPGDAIVTESPVVRESYPQTALVHAPSHVAAGKALLTPAPTLRVTGGYRPKPKPRPPRSAFAALIHFDFAKAWPPVRQHSERIEAIARVIARRAPVDGLRIEGHADERGDPPYNVWLSWHRSCNVARALRRLLAQHAPPIPLMQLAALGESQPAAPNTRPNRSDNPDGRAKNRRVRVSLLSHRPVDGLKCPPPPWRGLLAP
jgi:outer membrane protein OmpA-like peptidoglycan-associated protein